MFFRETTGVAEIRAMHRAIAAAANDALAEILARVGDAEHVHHDAARLSLAMAAEVIRGGLTELAIWWSNHPEVSREQIVATAMNTVWIGFERVSSGETWPR
jgi:hypothetical protein